MHGRTTIRIWSDWGKLSSCHLAWLFDAIPPTLGWSLVPPTGRWSDLKMDGGNSETSNRPDAGRVAVTPGKRGVLVHVLLAWSRGTWLGKYGEVEASQFWVHVPWLLSPGASSMLPSSSWGTRSRKRKQELDCHYFLVQIILLFIISKYLIWRFYATAINSINFITMSLVFINCKANWHGEWRWERRHPWLENSHLFRVYRDTTENETW